MAHVILNIGLIDFVMSNIVLIDKIRRVFELIGIQLLKETVHHQTNA